MKISKLKVTQAAMHDQPLLNSTGVHESFRVRTVVQIETDNGIRGAGEAPNDHSQVIEQNREWLKGSDPRQMTQV